VLKDDLLKMVNGGMTVFSPSNNRADERLHAVLHNGTDPGLFGVANSPEETTHTSTADIAAAGVLDPETVPTMDSIRDRIRTHIVENFAGHKLTYLVADILTVLGYVCSVSPEGADGGVDILAGRGPLGLDSPTLVVEVKSEPTAIGAPVVRGLQGAVTNNQADQGLLVAWGGVTGAARREFSHQRTRMGFWDAESLMEQLFKVYGDLPQETRNKLPLKLAWILDEEPGA
jgi:restriction system protein